MVGQIENSILCYTAGLDILVRLAKYLAEAHVQALEFDEAKELFQMALNIHKKNGAPASLEGAVDRSLMTLICDSKGD